MALTLPTSFPATLGLPGDLVLNIQCIDLDGDRYEACLLSDDVSPMAIAFGEGVDAPSAFLSLLGDENCDLGEGNFPSAAVLVLRDLAHQAVDMVCERLSSEPLERAVFADAPLVPCEHCPAPFQCDLSQCLPDALVKDVAQMLKVSIYAPSAKEALTS